MTEPPQAHADEPAGAAPHRWRIDKSLLIVSTVVGLGLALIVRGLFIGVTGDERAALPDLIERVDPVPEATQVLSQSSVFVDLASGYTGVLVIDDIELDTVNVNELAAADVEPGQQIDVPAVTVYEPGNATLTFTPSSGAAIPEFTDGEHRATVLYWRVDQSRQFARRFAWTFNVI